ncbi:hypothetical protein FHG68_17840 [Leptospira weilii]|nr:hypothetical protein FHG67_17785 [Leptospira weilii]QDK28315.1 hypothetical protein FHG68_17840 [Leptospira weilii]
MYTCNQPTTKFAFNFFYKKGFLGAFILSILEKRLVIIFAPNPDVLSSENIWEKFKYKNLRRLQNHFRSDLQTD